MQKVVTFASLAAFFFLFTPATRGQDAAEVESLRKDNELLKKENELLKKEIELLKKELQAKPGAAEDPGTGEKLPRTTAMMEIDARDRVQVELVKCVRGKEPTWVTFRFAAEIVAARPREEELILGGVRTMRLFKADGTRFDGKVIDPPGRVIVVKGETAKFQVSFRGVDPDIAEIDQVQLELGSKGGFSDPLQGLKFFRIKIETEK